MMVIQQIGVAAMVVTLMVAIGLRTSLSDFGESLRHPLRLLAALVVNMALIPAVTLAAAQSLGLPRDMIVGLLICAASPGGATGPLFAFRAGGHVATAVTAMVAMSMLSVVTAPLTLSFLLGMAVDLDMKRMVLPMMGTLLVFQLLPLVLGMVFRIKNPLRAEELAGPAGRLANTLLLMLIVGLLIARGRVLLEVGVAGLGLCIGLVVVNLALGAVLSTEGPIRRSLSMVTGVRNISLALLLSSSYFQAPLTDAAILAFGLFAMLIPLLLSRLLGAEVARRQG